MAHRERWFGVFENLLCWGAPPFRFLKGGIPRSYSVWDFPELRSDPLSCRCHFLLWFLFSAEILELIDLNLAFRKERCNYQLPAHSADKVLKRADVHVCAALHLRHRSLIHAENLGQMLLRHLPRFPEFIQRHLSPVLFCELAGPLPRCRRHLLP